MAPHGEVCLVQDARYTLCGMHHAQSTICKCGAVHGLVQGLAYRCQF